MKIGILTYHRSHNYGALLQAYALKHFLMKQGYNDVEFVDYFPDYHRDMYANIERKKFKNLPLLKKIKYPLYLAFRYYPLYFTKERRRKNFNKFIEKYIIEKEVGLKDTDYDLVIYGSDQIWRKQKQKTCPGFNEIYFGDPIIKAKKRIAFSASMGIIDLEPEDKVFLSKSFKSFASISVREKDLFEVIKSFSDYPVINTLDPVFLLTKDDWDNIIPGRIIKEKYVFFYNLQENKEAREIAVYISSRLGYKLIEFVGVIRKIYYPAGIKAFEGPENFLSLLKYSDFVVTSSFHGVAFSIIFEKQFYACLPWNNQRVISLLNLFQVQDRFIKDVKDVNLTRFMDYKIITPIVKYEKEKTIEYLHYAIGI